MNEQTNNTSAAFMEVTTRKVEVQDKKIADLESQIKHVKDNEELIQKLFSMIEELKTSVDNSVCASEKMEDFSARLDAVIRLIKQPLQNKVLHHHHIPKITWITVGLFIAFALVCSGWYMTEGKLDSYISNDIKYRYLRLDTTQRGLQNYLDRIDSLYNMRGDLQKIVLKTEAQYRVNFERLKKAERLKAEAADLEKSIKKR